MEKPLFSVGEEVILQSKSFPEMNGEDVVVEIIYNNSSSYDRVIEESVKFTGLISEGYAYKLAKKINYSGKTEDGRVCEGVWSESALRKKHKPSELSFQELVSSLKTPIKTPVKA